MKEFMDFTAIKVEVIIEDDEALSSLCLWWSKKPGSFFVISAEIDSSEIECEFCDQINGFVSKTISYQFEGNYLAFRLSNKETFDKAHIVGQKGELLQEIRIDIHNLDVPSEEIKACLASIFRG